MPFSGNDLDGNPNMKRYLFVFIIHWLSLHFPNTSQIIMKTLYLMMCMFTESRIEFSWRSPFYFLVMNCLCATACASVVKFWEIFLRPNKVRLESFATLQCKMVKTIHQEAKKISYWLLCQQGAGLHLIVFYVCHKRFYFLLLEHVYLSSFPTFFTSGLW